MLFYQRTKEFLMHIVKLLLSHQGRINRKIWWITQICIYLLALITIWVYHKFGFHDAIFGAILTVVLCVFRCFVNIKRVHDRGKSGWWLLFYELVPIVGQVWGFIELGFLRGNENENEHGPALL